MRRIWKSVRGKILIITLVWNSCIFIYLTPQSDPWISCWFFYITGLVAIGFVIVIILSLTIVHFHKRRNNRRDKQKQSQKVQCSHISNPMSKSGSNLFGVPILSYTELEEATSNFDEARELGSGGFGIVYYGKLFIRFIN